jgi:outer membrane protein TolC
MNKKFPDMKKSTYLLLLLSVLSPAFCAAQVASRYLSLQDAIEIAKQQSPDALNAKQQFRASFWEYKSFKASNLPALTLEGTTPSYSKDYTVYTSETGIETFIPQQKISADANMALTQQIGVTGGSIFLNSGLSGLYNFTDSTALTSYLSNPINIGIVQPIFKFNAYKWDRKIQPLKYDQAKQKYLEDIEQICITTTNYFFNLLQAQIDKKIAMTNLSNYDTLYKIAEGRYQLGKIAENDLLLLELNVLKARAAVEDANLGLDNAAFRFKSYLRIKDTIPINLVPPSTIDFFTVNPNEAIVQAKTNSSSYLDFQKRVLEAEMEVSKAKLDGRFDADLSAQFGLTQSASNVPDAYKNPIDQEQVSLGISIPLYDWGVARGRIKMAESEQEIVNNNVEQEMIDFDRNIYLKVVQFNMQQLQITIAAKSDTVARKTYDVTKGRYLIGKVVSVLDLNNAQIQTDASEKSYYDALYTFWRSYFELRKMTLFDFRNHQLIQFNMADIGM